MAGPRSASIVLGSALALALLLAACGGGEGRVQRSEVPDSMPCEPPYDCEDTEEPEPPKLTREQLGRFHAAQVAWHECATAEGLELAAPPSLEEFLAEDGSWWVGSALSEDEWNRMVEGKSGLDAACGEPPIAFDFLVDDEALARMYAWHAEVVACLRAEGYELTEPIPSLKDFVESGGTNWAPAREFHTRYGFPEGKPWHRVVERCGNPEGELWLGATDFVIDREALRGEYATNLALTTCLRDAGFVVPEPPSSLEEFVEQLGWNWTNADIWGAAYRDNDRGALESFVDRLDQGICPGV